MLELPLWFSDYSLYSILAFPIRAFVMEILTIHIIFDETIPIIYTDAIYNTIVQFIPFGR